MIDGYTLHIPPTQQFIFNGKRGPFHFRAFLCQLTTDPRLAGNLSQMRDIVALQETLMGADPLVLTPDAYTTLRTILEQPGRQHDPRNAFPTVAYGDAFLAAQPLEPPKSPDAPPIDPNEGSEE